MTASPSLSTVNLPQTSVYIAVNCMARSPWNRCWKLPSRTPASLSVSSNSLFLASGKFGCYSIVLELNRGTTHSHSIDATDYADVLPKPISEQPSLEAEVKLKIPLKNYIPNLIQMCSWVRPSWSQWELDLKVL